MYEIDPDEIAKDHPFYKLHPLRGVVWAAFWGTPVAAGIVMAINYWRIGQKSAARKVALLGVIATLALFAILFVVPEDILDKVPDIAFLIPQLLLVHQYAKNTQSSILETHEANGGAIASAWSSVGIGVLCLPVLLGAVFGVAYLLEPSYGTVIVFGNDEIYYSGEATEEDSRQLAQVLKEAEFFGSMGTSVRLVVSSGRYTVSFILVNDAWRDAETVAAFRGIGETIATSGIPSPLTIELCDEYFTAQETIHIE